MEIKLRPHCVKRQWRIRDGSGIVYVSLGLSCRMCVLRSPPDLPTKYATGGVILNVCATVKSYLFLSVALR